MRQALAVVGRGCITLGVLVLLFVAYQLWGTGLYTARAQHRLERQFEAAQDERRPLGTGAPATTVAPGATTTGGAPTSGPGSTAPPATTSPPAGPATSTTAGAGPTGRGGVPVAHLVIPRAGVDKYVVEGVGVADLRKGPGHYPSTPLPGQAGNAAIAGHRTTYGAPFGNLDALQAGDEIAVETLQGRFTYDVYEKLVVKPTATYVVAPDVARPATLTLTTCNPKYSASQRLVVKATLRLPPGRAPLPPSASGRTIDLSATEHGDRPSRWPTIAWGAVVTAVGGLWWLLFRRYRTWWAWLAGAVPFAVVLWPFFVSLERALPANY